MRSLQPTAERASLPPRNEVHTYALQPGDWVHTQRGPREVLEVRNGPAGGWRQVVLTDGTASVVYTQPWVVAAECDEDGCEVTALEGADYCAPHDAELPSREV